MSSSEQVPWDPGIFVAACRAVVPAFDAAAEFLPDGARIQLAPIFFRDAPVQRRITIMREYAALRAESGGLVREAAEIRLLPDDDVRGRLRDIGLI